MRHIPPHSLAAWTLACASLVGCAIVRQLPSQFQDLHVELAASKTEFSTAAHARLLFELAVNNPNTYALALRHVHCRLSVNRRALAEGTVAEHIALPPESTTIVRLRVWVEVGNLLAAAHGTAALGEIPYQLDGSLAVGSLLWHRRVPFTLSSVLRPDIPLGLARLTHLPSRDRAG